MNDDPAARERLAANLQTAFPPILSGGDFVTRHEFVVTVQLLDQKIENSVLKMRNWVLGGVVAIILALGGGYVSMVTKLEKLGETLTILEGRRAWMLRQDQRDDQQDRQLSTIANDYTPMPYVEPPR